jgi:polar amino acid transport system substrate-binding protein
MHYKSLIAALPVLFLTFQGVAAEESSTKIPNFVGESELSGSSGISSIRNLRFLTTLNFPPFNYLDERDRLTGFNVYLAKAICAEMSIQAACTIQAVPFEELIPTMISGRADAIISGFASSAGTRDRFGFTNSYLRFPGRFVATKTARISNKSGSSDFDGGLEGAKIGVIAGSGHEKLARSYFPQATVIGFADEQFLTADLTSGKIDLMFGDGMKLSFWLHGQASKGCCNFIGEAYYSSEFLGEGMRIAALNSRPDVIRAINQSLDSIQRKHGVDELFLRFFPNRYY